MAKVYVEGCIGCGACVGACPDVFDLNEEGLAYNIFGDEVEDDYMADVEVAASSCPVEAIKVG